MVEMSFTYADLFGFMTVGFSMGALAFYPLAVGMQIIKAMRAE